VGSLAVVEFEPREILASWAAESSAAVSWVVASQFGPAVAAGNAGPAGAAAVVRVVL